MKQKLSQKNKEDLDHSNMLNESVHDVKKAIQSNYLRNTGRHQKEDFGEADLIDMLGHDKDSIASIILKKFNSRPKGSKKTDSFFVQ